MNIWQFLDLPKSHREPNKTAQLVRAHDDVAHKVTWPRKAQKKEDGIFSFVVLHKGKVGVFGRTGLALKSVEHLHPRLTAAHGQLSVATIAELCCDTCSLEELGGIVNPNRTGALDETQAKHIGGARFAFHDIITVEELVAGFSAIPYGQREQYLRRLLKCVAVQGAPVESEWVNSEAEAEAFADRHIALNAEGAVFKDDAADWVAGRKNEVATKKVRGVDFDLLVVGVEEGGGKFSGMVGNLLLRWRMYGKNDGDVITIPSDGCFDIAMRKAWLADPASIIGKVVHVHALQIASKGSLRLPKVRSVRIDKAEADL